MTSESDVSENRDQGLPGTARFLRGPGSNFQLPDAVQIIRSASDLDSGLRPVCAAIGVFDGLHLGHQAVLGRARVDAEAAGGCLVAVTFDRHPNSVVAPDRTPASIYSLGQKLNVLRALNADVTWLIPFDREFSRIPAEEFVAHWPGSSLRYTVSRSAPNSRLAIVGEGTWLC